MSPSTVLTVGLVAGLLTTGSWIPQAIRTLRSRSAKDFSWIYLIAFTSGVTLWGIYGVLQRDPAVFIANFVTLAFLVPIHVVKSREGGR